MDYQSSLGSFVTGYPVLPAARGKVLRDQNALIYVQSIPFSFRLPHGRNMVLLERKRVIEEGEKE